MFEDGGVLAILVWPTEMQLRTWSYNQDFDRLLDVYFGWRGSARRRGEGEKTKQDGGRWCEISENAYGFLYSKK